MSISLETKFNDFEAYIALDNHDPVIAEHKFRALEKTNGIDTERLAIYRIMFDDHVQPKCTITGDYVDAEDVILIGAHPEPYDACTLVQTLLCLPTYQYLLTDDEMDQLCLFWGIKTDDFKNLWPLAKDDIENELEIRTVTKQIALEGQELHELEFKFRNDRFKALLPLDKQQSYIPGIPFSNETIGHSDIGKKGHVYQVHHVVDLTEPRLRDRISMRHVISTAIGALGLIAAFYYRSFQ
jgi:hypothetical protein